MSPFLLRVALLLVASGFCSLVYQIAWLRLLRLVFGASTAASAAVLAIFMGGLGLGSLLLGPRADRARSPLGLYARLEVGIAVGAALSPLLVAAIRWLYLEVGGTERLGLVGGTAARLALAALVLGVPAFLMGGTLPATVRAVTRSADAGRRRVGLLYAANTLGAVAGTLATTFVAIELLGIGKTLWVAALLNLLVAIFARALARSPAALGAAPDAVAPPVSAQELETGGEPAGPIRRAPLAIVLAAAAVTGFVFFLMELVWYRMLGPILGGTSYTFGLILAVALLGIGAGGLIYGLGSERVRPSLLGFAATCALEALALVVPFALGDRVAFLALELQGLGAAGFGGLLVGWSAVTALVVLPAALVSGYQFPLLVAILGQGRRAVGREVGLAYAWNTAGAILGSIAGGFGLLPILSAPGAWRAAAALLVLLALVSTAVAGVREGARSTAVTATALLALVALLAAASPGPSAFWRHSGIGAGRFRDSLGEPNDLRKAIREHKADIAWEADGRESGVALVRSAGYAFIVNGKSDGAALGDAGTQIMGGLVGAMLHPRPERALVIGLGTGSTAGWLAEVATMERVDAVELEPAIVRVARDCAPVNHAAMDHPKVEVVVGDGREVLLTTRRRYDVIFSEPSNPYRAGISSLYTREFYEAARDRLQPGGLFLQWLQGYEVDASVVRTAYATLAAVFPAVESWRTLPGDLLLVASAEPLSHDLERVRRRSAEEPYVSALARAWGVAGAEGFYAGFVADPAFARAMAEAEGAVVNTDDHPIIEYGFVRNLGRTGLFDIDDLARLARTRGEHRPRFAGAEADGWLVDDAVLARGALFDDVPPLPEGADPELRERHRLRSAYAGKDWRALREGWADREPALVHRVDLLAWASALAEGGDPRAEEAAARLWELSPGEAEAVLALFEARRENDQTAGWYLSSLFSRLRIEPWVQPDLLSSALRLAMVLGRRDQALAETLFEELADPFAVALAHEERLYTRLQLAGSLGRDGACVEAFAPLEPWVAWDEATLASRVACYTKEDHRLLSRARRELAEWRSHRPPQLDAGLAPANEEAELPGRASKSP
ncbi:MAG TPA: fused MFS/spermidine synthase [Thermoanaerobaculia bacterium]|nr:fused MFS/spermidine synthase [Thermoanaerobaculia bacterium]